VAQAGPRRLGRIVIRTKFFDDAILAALGAGQHQLFAPLAPAQGAPACTQVGGGGSGSRAGAATQAALAGRRGSLTACEALLAVEMMHRDWCWRRGPPPAPWTPLPQPQPPSPPASQEARSALLCAAQVVLLGAGMDSRPWRLALPAGTAWFEVDRQDVLRAKASTLQRHGAQVEGSVQVGPAPWRRRS
jgi:hypothetical protein